MRIWRTEHKGKRRCDTGCVSGSCHVGTVGEEKWVGEREGEGENEGRMVGRSE